MLLHDTKAILAPDAIRIWTNASVPSDDGGISLGQAALAAFGVASYA
jgi:hydrogenase maturation protein HypF